MAGEITTAARVLSSPLAPGVTRPPLPTRRQWTLPERGLVVFQGGGDTARLSHYFLPRLLQEGKRVLILDGANCADPRLMERLARQRAVPFEQFSQQIEIARAFTCFQLTELIARLPQLLADFPAQVLMVTAFPELYFDEDVRDWNARVAFEQALRNLRRSVTLPAPWSPDKVGTPGPPLAVALFSSATTFTPSRARQRFFAQTCAAASEVWKFSLDEDQRLQLTCERTPWQVGEASGLPPSPAVNHERERTLPR